MNASVISALAALLGAMLGGLTSMLASWWSYKAQARTQWMTQDRMGRQELYKEFIEEAASCYADALQHEKAEAPALVGLYAKIGRMRILSSPSVLASAEEVARKILNTYLEPNKTFLQLREMADSNTIDILGDFSKACREEFELLRSQQF